MGQVKAVTKYETSDGKTHDDINAARKHEAMFTAISKVKTALTKASQNCSLGTLHIDLVNNPTAAAELRDALNIVLDTHRRHGKLKKKAA
jgi:hypothetical protein